jgi:ATP-dependent Clp protease ATP-binding subunit ClpX
VPPQGGRKHPQQKYIEVNTKNILFICGGAFEGLEKIVEHRIGRKVLGWRRNHRRAKDKPRYSNSSRPTIVKYGLIPRWWAGFRGRRAVRLDQDALVQILRKPKNPGQAVPKLFQMEDVERVFTDDALRVIAATAKKETGARGCVR